MSVLQVIYKGKKNATQDPKVAANILSKGESVVLYDINCKKLYKIIEDTREIIKERNKGIDNINEQTIITTPYFFDAIDGCLSVYAAEVEGRKFKDAQFAYFWDAGVLDQREHMDIGKNARAILDEFNKNNRLSHGDKSPVLTKTK